MQSKQRSFFSVQFFHRLFCVGISGVLFASMLVSCADPNAPRYEETECQFYVESAREIECGILKVPEDRGQEEGPMIELHFAILRSNDPDKAPDPVIVLQGGPGVEALEMMDYWFYILLKTLFRRDVIVLDQRGVGYSQPSLNCPELEEPFYAQYAENLSSAEVDERYNQALKSCRERLVQDGIDLNAYNSAASAADVNDLRRALGYSEWNLYGSSYGTRLALTVMRDFPEGVRSVILDSVYPPQVDLFSSLAVNMERALNLLFERCATDAECNQSYPNLERVFYQVVDQVDAEPVTLSLDHSHDGEPYEVVINGDRLIRAFFDLLYWGEGLPGLPEMIYEIQAGEWERFARLIRSGLFIYDELSEGMYYSVECVEEAPFGSPEEVAVANAGVNPRLSTAMNNASYYQDCAVWQVTPAPGIENQAVVSDIPTLILVGEHDPITPPAWGLLALERISARRNTWRFLALGMESLGVPLSGGKCSSRNIVEAFLADPSAPVEASCVAELPLLFGSDE